MTILWVKYQSTLPNMLRFNTNIQWQICCDTIYTDKPVQLDTVKP